MSTEEKIKKIIESVIGDGSWDSFAQLMIINKVEKEFNIRIDDREIMSLKSAEKLVKYVNAHGQ